MVQHIRYNLQPNVFPACTSMTMPIWCSQNEQTQIGRNVTKKESAQRRLYKKMRKPIYNMADHLMNIQEKKTLHSTTISTTES